MAESNEYNLSWFELMKYHERKNGTYRVVIYGVGHWINHIMDWAGCNFFHGRLPNSPIFDTPAAAAHWLKDVWEPNQNDYLNSDGGYSGHHAGAYKCLKGCNQRTIEIIYPRDLRQGN